MEQKGTMEEILIETGRISPAQLKRLHIMEKRCPEMTLRELLAVLGYVPEKEIPCDSRHMDPADQEKMSGDQKEDEKQTEVQDQKEESDAPAVRMVNHLIEAAYLKNASDIHVEPGPENCAVRLRINGDLEPYTTADMALYYPIATRLKLMGGMDIAEKRLPQDGKYRYCQGEISTDLRISTLPSVYGEKVVLRLLGNDRERELMDIRRLGMDSAQEEAFDRMLRSPYGLVLVTGPTGSGKSTTLYAVLTRLAGGKINAVTVEDPVEKEITGTTQVQVNPKAGLTFARALRSILRQDPDVIMIGEMRDEETADIGVRAAITGHLVLSTLHTNDCSGAVDRLRNMGLPSYLIAASLTGVVAQRLVKILCPHCRRPADKAEKEKQIFYGLTGIQPETLWEAPGCEHCHGTGCAGRRAIYEIMEMDEELKDRIRKNDAACKIRKYLRSQGSASLKDQAVKLAVSGEIDFKEAERILYCAE